MTSRTLSGCCVALLLCPWPVRSAVIHTIADPAVVVDDFSFDVIFALDLDGNGASDFEFFNDGREADLRTLGANRVIGPADNGRQVSPLAAGAVIGADLDPSTAWTESFFRPPPFASSEVRPILVACASGGAGTVCLGTFPGVTAFAGFEFEIDGATHYGWLRATGWDRMTGLTVHDWAYESEPGVAIRAGEIPEPSVGALLLLAALVVVRRRGRMR